MKLLVCGSRTWNNRELIFNVLSNVFFEVKEMIQGGARGADTIAREWALQTNVPCITRMAKWTRYHGAAGPLRNREMVAVFKPDQVLAFRMNGRSDGTDDMVSFARECGIPVTIYYEDGRIVTGDLSFTA